MADHSSNTLANESYSDMFRPEPTAWDCPPVTDSMIIEAQRTLGHVLPEAYVSVLRYRNGGLLRRNTFMGQTANLRRSYPIPVLMGLGGPNGIDTLDPFSSRPLSAKLILEWNYPVQSVVICHFGHQGVLLSYSAHNPDEDPKVVFADAENYPNVETVELAPNFASLLLGLYVG